MKPPNFPWILTYLLTYLKLLLGSVASVEGTSRQRRQSSPEWSVQGEGCHFSRVDVSGGEPITDDVRPSGAWSSPRTPPAVCSWVEIEDEPGGCLGRQTEQMTIPTQRARLKLLGQGWEFEGPEDFRISYPVGPSGAFDFSEVFRLDGIYLQRLCLSQRPSLSRIEHNAGNRSRIYSCFGETADLGFMEDCF